LLEASVQRDAAARDDTIIIATAKQRAAPSGRITIGR